MAIKIVQSAHSITGIEVGEYYVAEIAKGSYAVMHLRAWNDPHPMGGHDSKESAIRAAETLTANARGGA